MLPPGQHAIDGFPRFGTHLHEPPPTVPAEPALEVAGALSEPLTLPLTALAQLPRRELIADFHCVAGWSATGLRWEGVAFADFWREVVEPVLAPGAGISHVVFHSLDGFWSYMELEDALDDEVLLAERLGGRPLDGDHGAPLRLVSPKQYGFVSAKHLCRIEALEEEPRGGFGTATTASRLGLRLAWFKRHPRARVWEEERHRYLPAWPVRVLGRVLRGPTSALSRRGGGR